MKNQIKKLKSVLYTELIRLGGAIQQSPGDRYLKGRRDITLEIMEILSQILKK